MQGYKNNLNNMGLNQPSKNPAQLKKNSISLSNSISLLPFCVAAAFIPDRFTVLFQTLEMPRPKLISASKFKLQNEKHDQIQSDRIVSKALIRRI